MLLPCSDRSLEPQETASLEDWPPRKSSAVSRTADTRYAALLLLPSNCQSVFVQSVRDSTQLAALDLGNYPHNLLRGEICYIFIFFISFSFETLMSVYFVSTAALVSFFFWGWLKWRPHNKNETHLFLFPHPVNLFCYPSSCFLFSLLNSIGHNLQYSYNK